MTYLKIISLLAVAGQLRISLECVCDSSCCLSLTLNVLAQRLNETHRQKVCSSLLAQVNKLKCQRAPWLLIDVDIACHGAGVCACINVRLCKPETGFCKYSYLLTWGKNSCWCNFAFRQVRVKGMSNANNLSWLTVSIFFPSLPVFFNFLSLFFSFLSPRCCSALPAVQRGRPELWDPAPGSLRCRLRVWGIHPVARALAPSRPQTSPSAPLRPAPTLPGPHGLRHQHQKLTSPRAPQERTQAFLPTSVHLSGTVTHTVEGAAGGQKQCWAGGAQRWPEETTGGNTDNSSYSLCDKFYLLIPVNFIIMPVSFSWS